MNSKIAVAVGLAAVLAAVLALTPISTPTPAFADTVSVDITQGSQSKTTDAFSPNPVEVKVGDTVTWTNKDATPHTVTSGQGGSSPKPDGKFNSSPNFNPTINAGQTYSVKFNETGDYPYYCELHSTMVGTVKVAAAGGGGTPQEAKVTATLDGKPYDITYKSTTSKATQATIQSGQSVTVNFDKAGEVELTLPKNMISGVNSIMAGSQELLQGNPTVNADGSSTVKFTLPEGSTTVVIKGATVIPEFPIIAAAILAGSIAAIIGYTRLARNGSGLLGRS
jgi:plastocyanin